ncbi:hypothetical protein SBY92_002603 [Candida maltosa Xu316]
MISIFQQLLNLTSRLMSYYVDVISYIYNDLKHILKYQISPNTNLVNNINIYLGLIDKYKTQMTQLSNIDHVLQIYKKLLEFINPGLTQILNHLSSLNATNEPLLRKSLIGVFIRTGIEEKIKFIVEENKKPLDRFEKDPNTANDFLERLNNEISTIPPSSYITQSLTRFVEELVQEYTLDIPLLELAMDKLNTNYKEEKKLDKLKNSILQRIIEQEVDTSSVSFTETEVKTIDLLEYLTAHIDFVKRLLPIYIRFDKLLFHKLRIDKLPCPEPGNIESILDHVIEPFIDTLVIGGTVGLSKDRTYHLVFSFVQDLAIELFTLNKNYHGFIPQNRPGRYGDDESFWNSIHAYAENLLQLTYFLQNSSKGAHDVNRIMGDLKEEFEQAENEAREDFFNLMVFEKIFECDKRILKHQLRQILFGNRDE